MSDDLPRNNTFSNAEAEDIAMYLAADNKKIDCSYCGLTHWHFIPANSEYRCTKCGRALPRSVLMLLHMEKPAEAFLFDNFEVAEVFEYLNAGNSILCSICGKSSWHEQKVGRSYKIVCTVPSCIGQVHRGVLKSIQDPEPIGITIDTRIYNLADIQEELSEQGWTIVPTGPEQSKDTNKLDQGKLMAGILEEFLPALNEVAKLGSMNNKPNGKYERGSWQRVENGEQRYLDAFWRHILSGRKGIDPETGMPHDVAIAWNALALIWFRLKREGKV